MEKGVFHIVDVFTEEKLAGNQLAVFLPGRHYSDIEMQRLAKEMNYSETTFILSGEQTDGGYDVRIFTPEAEVPFAGHPTLGTAFVIQREIVRQAVETITLNLKVGRIPVTFEYAGGKPADMWMKQVPPEFGETFDAGAVAAALSLGAADIDHRFPVEAVSTGIPFIIVPLLGIEALKRCVIVKDRYSSLIAASEAKAILVFAPEAHRPGNDLSVRVFADYYGVPEDPATGSANGCLAGYLVKHRYFGGDEIDTRCEQGYEIGRPSLLLLRAATAGTRIDVHVGGRAIMVARGELV
jgi:trans-2,3-dihydro-3-hydroxyanthranilate isomerase